MLQRWSWSGVKLITRRSGAEVPKVWSCASNRQCALMSSCWIKHRDCFVLSVPEAALTCCGCYWSELHFIWRRNSVFACLYGRRIQKLPLWAIRPRERITMWVECVTMRWPDCGTHLWGLHELFTWKGMKKSAISRAVEIWRRWLPNTRWGRSLGWQSDTSVPIRYKCRCACCSTTTRRRMEKWR